MAPPSAPDLDWPRLDAWLERNAAGFHGLRAARRLVGGNSNPIWRLDADSGAYVLRAQPPGELLSSAHALDREFRVLDALRASPAPAPRVRAFCADLSVIGVQFYLMDFVDGRVFRNPKLEDAPREKRRAVFDAALDMLATIHCIDVAAVGLSDFGRPGHYYQRQLHRWSQQIARALPEGDATLDALLAALRAAMPQTDRAATLLHGDSRFDNLMFDARGERIVAVLDWELSTLGDPLADLGQFLAVQELPSDYLLPGLGGLDRAAHGVPTQEEQAARYFAQSGQPAADMRFYMAFAMFRQAAMSAGLKRRALLGTALTEEAFAFGETLSVFAELGLRMLGR
jgi:aminoglycoside phosphotransferase (APT) family kinase protein